MMPSLLLGRRALLSAAVCLASACTASVYAQERDTSAEVRVHISIAARQLFVIVGDADTVFSAPAAVGSGRTLKADGRTWKFRTPVGVTRVTAKEVAPLWVPPDWHYVEVARSRDLGLSRLAQGDTVPLSKNRFLVVRGETIGLIQDDTAFVELVADEEIVFDGTLFIPPFGTKQRRISGQLGPYRLVLANGVGIHGTPYKDSIGKAVTHGCIRMHDEDITWLYENIPVGTAVVIH
jgi:hypothetical protein